MARVRKRKIKNISLCINYLFRYLGCYVMFMASVQLLYSNPSLYVEVQLESNNVEHLYLIISWYSGARFARKGRPAPICVCH